jgi:hypothetical protein
MILQGQVGPQVVADGSQVNTRLGRLGELFISDSVGKYYELCRRGQIFSAAMQAGASLGTALTSTAVTLTLYNPAGSGVNLVLLQCGVNMTTVPVVAEVNTLVYAGNVNTAAAAPSTVTAAVIQSGLLGGAAGQGKAYTAATLPAAPVVVRTFPLAWSNVVTTEGYVGGLGVMDYVDGALSLAQNTAVTIQQIAGTTASGIVFMTWAEIPV